MQTDSPVPSRVPSSPVEGVEKFGLSESAQKRIAKLLTDEPEGTVLRISVMGGGCSGFQYKYDFETTPTTDDDFLIQTGGVRVAVDSTSLEFLTGSILDYVETLGGSAFEIKNPNTTASCGCGNSFSVV